MLRVGLSASGTSRRSASLDGTVIFMISVVCIALPINRADDLSADKVVGFSAFVVPKPRSGYFEHA